MFGNELRMPTITTSLNTVLEILVKAIRQEQAIKRYKDWREKVKLSLFANDKIVHAESIIRINLITKAIIRISLVIKICN